MAKLRTAMDSAFWDVELATPRVIDGSAKAVPCEALPLDGSRASRVFRFEQISLLRNGFPLGLIPSFSPPLSSNSKSLGSFSLQSLVIAPVTPSWWLGMMGQFRPKKLFTSLKAELTRKDDEPLTFKDVAKRFVEKSLFSLGLTTQFTPIPSTSIKWTTELHGDKEEKRHKLMLFHQLSEHDITLEAAWPQLFVDSKGQYWDVPESISLDLLSTFEETGLQYRLGLHKNTGHPNALDTINPNPPTSLMPGIWAKAALSYEKSMDFWRKVQRNIDIVDKTENGLFLRRSYDSRLNEPHSAISGIIGGNFAALVGGDSSVSVESKDHNNSISTSINKRSPISADIFGSVCYTYQLGNFRNLYNDLTRIDARLDICSASALAKKLLNRSKNSSARVGDSNLSPRLNLIFQQQLGGPIVLRLDSRISLGSSLEKKRPHMDDFILSLTYSFQYLDSGKAVFWYSPKRKEGMVELRVFEF